MVLAGGLVRKQYKGATEVVYLYVIRKAMVAAELVVVILSPVLDSGSVYVGEVRLSLHIVNGIGRATPGHES